MVFGCFVRIAKTNSPTINDNTEIIKKTRLYRMDQSKAMQSVRSNNSFRTDIAQGEANNRDYDAIKYSDAFELKSVQGFDPYYYEDSYIYIPNEYNEFTKQKGVYYKIQIFHKISQNGLYVTYKFNCFRNTGYDVKSEQNNERGEQTNDASSFDWK
jgi:hypothetical protein